METQIASLTKLAKKRLGFQPMLHLKAAECWLALGEIREAQREMKKITRKHPAVTHVHKKIQAHIQYVRTLVCDGVVLNPYWDSDQLRASELAQFKRAS